MSATLVLCSRCSLPLKVIENTIRLHFLSTAGRAAAVGGSRCAGWTNRIEVAVQGAWDRQN